ncbi:GPI-anchor transamidase subunit K [Nematocida sp. AWRm78]|nr:GPI-anchor transamidase subunit K [Nematocida sp. AWRm78]KAI5187735.1 GPI-anchor transamidase subunit K [Nematocida sp. AWRm78]
MLLSFILIFIYSVSCSNKAILINCSWQYENYRHFSNVIALQSILESNGFTPKDISVFSKQDLLDDKRMREKHIKTDYFTLEKNKNYTPISRNTSYFDILNMISGNDSILLNTNEHTNLLIYITGHGGNGFIKYCNRTYLYKNDITDALINLQRIRKLKSVLFIADTCQADTLIDKSRLPENVTFVSTSLKGESSHSTTFSERLNVFPIDLFIMHLYKIHQEKRIFNGVALSEFIKSEFPEELVKSTVTFTGPDVNLYDFVFQRKIAQNIPENLYL